MSTEVKHNEKLSQRFVLPILGAGEAPKQGYEMAPGQKPAWTHARGVTGPLNQRGGAVVEMSALAYRCPAPRSGEPILYD